jgi:23S rRNA (uracil1939-C5)-methyltransferase
MIGSQFTGKVRDISIEGYGVVDHPTEKLVFFVLGTFPGDEALFEVVHLKERYGYARLVEMTQLSDDRIPSACSHAGIREGLCGGCPWIEIAYPKQLEFKRHMLKHALQRDHLLPDGLDVPPIHGSPLIFGFRNRAQFKTDGDFLGYVSRFSRTIAPIKDCLVLNEPLRHLLRESITKLPIDSWCPTPTHPWSYIDMDDETTFDSIVPNKRRPFRQGNSQQNDFMKAWVDAKTKHWKGGTALELFCGSGNFTEVIAAQQLQNFVATDIASEGIRRLRDRDLVSPCTIVEANLFKPSDWKLIKAENPFVDFLFLDPPRDGFSKLDMFVGQWGYPREVVYISCSLDTFTHDAGRLKKKGYRITEILGIDQFPHTPHIEILSVLKRQ